MPAKKKTASGTLKNALRPGFPYVAALGLLFILLILLLSLPAIFEWKQEFTLSQKPSPFPLSVYPAEKKIVANPAADALLPGTPSALSAAAVGLSGMFDSLAVLIGSSPWYEAVAASDARFVTVDPGWRKEEVGAAFGKTLGWTASETKRFLADVSAPGAVSDGYFAPETYVLGLGTTPEEAALQVENRFQSDFLARYATSTREVVPVSEALTIASMIERETSDPAQMRLVSGIIWNRLFAGMNLQLDSTVQYAKGTSKKWWPTVSPKDLSVKSPYNTYTHEGLPPGPISNPGVAAVIAALNPVQTSCLFYFHDDNGDIHCSDTYADHVALLKKYFGQGK
jgi:UPF0755 protein